MVITLLHNFDGALDVDQLNIWANAFGLNHPVVDDENDHLSGTYWPDDVGRPKSVLLGPGARIVTFSPSEADVASQL